MTVTETTDVTILVEQLQQRIDRLERALVQVAEACGTDIFWTIGVFDAMAKAMKDYDPPEDVIESYTEDVAEIAREVKARTAPPKRRRAPR